MKVAAKVALLHGKLVTDADQSSVSCKLVHTIKIILGTISKIPFGFAVLNSLISWKIELCHKVPKKQSYYIPRQSFSNFLPNSTDQVPLSYSQELQSIHATVDFEKTYIW